MTKWALNTLLCLTTLVAACYLIDLKYANPTFFSDLAAHALFFEWRDGLPLSHGLTQFPAAGRATGPLYLFFFLFAALFLASSFLTRKQLNWVTVFVTLGWMRSFLGFGEILNYCLLFFSFHQLLHTGIPRAIRISGGMALLLFSCLFYLGAGLPSTAFNQLIAFIALVAGCVSLMRIFVPALDRAKQWDWSALLLLLAAHIYLVEIAPPGKKIFSSLSLFLFLFQSVRLALYWTEIRSGQAPRNLGFLDFFSMFATPAGLVAWVTPQAYVHLNERFRNTDLFKIWRSGCLIIGGGLFGLIFGDVLISVLAQFGNYVPGIYLDPTLNVPIAALKRFERSALISLLLSGCLKFLYWYLQLLGINHFRIGLWRLLGFNVDPHFRFPFVASSLAETWRRFVIHLRVCLGELFFKPAFWALSSLSMPLRLLLSNLYALAVGSFALHISRDLLKKGFGIEVFEGTVSIAGYFVVMAIGISFSHWRLLYWGRRNWLPAPLGYLWVILFMGFCNMFTVPGQGPFGINLFILIWENLWT